MSHTHAGKRGGERGLKKALRPSQRREMVGLFRLHGLSHRRSCRMVRLSRSVDKYSASEHNQPLLKRMKELAFEHIHYGYQRIWALLRRESWTVSLNRVKRLWKLNHLQVPKRKPKQRRRGPCVEQYSCQALAPNHVWSLDFVADRLGHGGRLRMLTLVDEFTRESLAISVKRSQKAVDVQETLAQVMKDRGQPCYLRSDNGSEFIEKSLQKWLKDKGVASIFIEPGSPWQNCPQSLPEGLFNGKLRTECLSATYFRTLREAKVLIEMWRKEYNTFRPHRALKLRTPAEFAQAWNT